MQLDDLQRTWAAHGAALERCLAIDERLLRETVFRRARWSLVPFVVWRALEVVLGVAALSMIASVLGAHWGSPRYVAVGCALLVYAVGVAARSAQQLVGGLRLDYDGPVAAIQREVARLQTIEQRAFKWAFLGGVLLWLPALLVAFEALTGVAALERVDLAWLLGNLVFGVLALALGQHIAVRRLAPADRSPWAQRVLDGLSDRRLRAISSRLAELSQFVRDDAPPR